MGPSRLPLRSPRAWGALLLPGLLLLASACYPYHPQSTFDPAGPVARWQRDIYYLLFWAAVFVFVTVTSALVFALVRYRGRRRDGGLPPQVHGNRALEIAWTFAPAVVLTVIAVPMVMVAFRVATPPAGTSLEVRVVGHQWWWEFNYPDLGFTTANEMHIPVGRPVKLVLESADVIHSFWVPKLAGKTDNIPNRQNTMWLQADEPGVYMGQCAELCGVGHALMRFRVVAQPEEEFQAWVEAQKAPPREPATPLAREGARLFAQGACIACHTIRGISEGTLGPDLTHLASRQTLAAGTLENTPENLARWLRNPQAVKPGAKMPNLGLSEGEIRALVAYLESLK